MPDSILTWGIELVLWMQSWGEWFVVPMNIMTFTGTAEFYLLILPVLYWCLDTRFGLRMAIALLLSLIINITLKIVFNDPRPYWYDSRVLLWAAPERSFGIPSGHAQNSVVLWGMFADYINKRWAWALAGGLVLLSGISRIYLGVHFPTDVLVGWLIGGAVLVLFLRLEEPGYDWISQRTRQSQIGLALALSLGLILLAVGILAGVTAYTEQPNIWFENALLAAPDDPIRPLSLADVIAINGVLLGMVTGAVLFNANHSFNPGGRWFERLARYFVGLVGVVIIWLGLRSVAHAWLDIDSMADYLFAYVRYVLIGLWITWFAPLVFIKLGVAQPRNDAVLQQT